MISRAQSNSLWNGLIILAIASAVGFSSVECRLSAMEKKLETGKGDK